MRRPAKRGAFSAAAGGRGRFFKHHGVVAGDLLALERLAEPRYRLISNR